jgi:hypothetical protein
MKNAFSETEANLRINLEAETISEKMGNKRSARTPFNDQRFDLGLLIPLRWAFLVWLWFVWLKNKDERARVCVDWEALLFWFGHSFVVGVVDRLHFHCRGDESLLHSHCGWFTLYSLFPRPCAFNVVRRSQVQLFICRFANAGTRSKDTYYRYAYNTRMRIRRVQCGWMRDKKVDVDIKETCSSYNQKKKW